MRLLALLLLPSLLACGDDPAAPLDDLLAGDRRARALPSKSGRGERPKAHASLSTRVGVRAIDGAPLVVKSCARFERLTTVDPWHLLLHLEHAPTGPRPPDFRDDDPHLPTGYPLVVDPHEMEPWYAGDGAFAEARLDVARTVDALRVVVRSGEREVVLAAAPGEPAGDPRPLLHDATLLELVLRADGLSVLGQTRRWAQGRLDPRAGRCTVVVRGALHLVDRAPLPFAAAPIQLDLTGPDARLPLDQLEARACEVLSTWLREDGYEAEAALLASREVRVDAASTVGHVTGRRRLHVYQSQVGRSTEEGEETAGVVYRLDLAPDGTALAYRGCPTYDCVAAGTTIATPEGAVPVESLRVGQVVDSYDPATRRPCVARVVGLRRSAAPALFDIDGLRVTGGHPLWTGRWTFARDIQAGDAVLDRHGRTRPVARVRRVAGGPVVRLSVAPPHTYFAGPGAGALVHNKSPWWPRTADAWRRLVEAIVE